ncbi:MAG: tetratricopeptide repeat protein [Acidobacteriota bacterium]
MFQSPAGFLGISVVLLILALVMPSATWGVDLPESTAESIDAASPLAEARAAYYFALAKLLAEGADYEGALEAFEKALDLDPQDPYIFIEAARFDTNLAQLSRSPQYQERYLDLAADHVEQARQLAPGNSDVLRAYADVHLRLGRQRPASMALAQGAYEAVREAGEADFNVLTSLGQIYLWSQQHDKALEVLGDAAGRFPENRIVQTMLVEAQLASDNPDQTADAMLRLLQLEPESLDPRLRLAQLYGERGDHAKALATLQEAPEQLSERPRLRQAIARELHLLGRSAEASEILDGLAETYENSAAFHRLRAAVLGALLAHDLAADKLERALELEAEAGLERRAQDDLLLARVYERSGRDADAVTRLNDAISVAPATERGQLRLGLAGIHQRWGRPAAARSVLEEALADATLPAVRRAAVAQVLVEQQLDAEAVDEALAIADRVESELATAGEEDVARQLTLSLLVALADEEQHDQLLERLNALPPLPDPAQERAVLQLRAGALAGLGEVDEALDVLDEVGDSNARPILAERLRILFEGGRETEAARMIEALAAEGDLDERFFLARVLQREERHADAVPMLEAVLAERPDDQATLFSLGAAYERTGQLDAAESTFLKLLDQSPDDPQALNYLGYMWAEQGRNLERALEMIERAVAAAPDQAAYVDSLGWVLHKLGRDAEAVPHLEWAARLSGTDPTVHDHLGDVYRALGRPDEAIEQYRVALDLGAEDPQSIESKLEALGAPSEPDAAELESDGLPPL